VRNPRGFLPPFPWERPPWGRRPFRRMRSEPVHRGAYAVVTFMAGPEYTMGVVWREADSLDSAVAMTLSAFEMDVSSDVLLRRGEKVSVHPNPYGVSHVQIVRRPTSGLH